MKPICYIDVDGVLNKFGEKSEYSFDKHVTFSGNTYRIRLDKRHGQWLLDLAEKTGAELIWATTWMGLANEHIGPEIGLPELPYVDFGSPKWNQSSGAWKALGVINHFDKRPFLWFDDDFTINQILFGAITTEYKVHLVNDRAGLTERDISFAYQWFKNL